MENQTAEVAKHDALERAHEDEPHFALLARDLLAPEHVRYYGAARAHNFDMMDAIHRRIKERVAKLPIHFDKDRAHQRSASAVAIQMELWFEERRIEMEKAGEDGTQTESEIAQG